MNLMAIVTLAILVIKIFALVNCLLYSAEAYPAASRGTKTAWGIGLGLGVVVELVGLPMIINLAFLVAALVYLADVRPALKSLTRR
jgi:hypothetical protein